MDFDALLAKALSKQRTEFQSFVKEALDQQKTELKEALDQQKKELIQMFDEKLKPLHIKSDILSAKLANSQLGRSDKLAKVPKSDGIEPAEPYPNNIMQLLVAGNEKLPDGNKNSWNKKSSRQLLMQYGEDPEASDNDNEYSESSRYARLKVARVLGVSKAQLNYALQVL